MPVWLFIAYSLLMTEFLLTLISPGTYFQALISWHLITSPRAVTAAREASNPSLLTFSGEFDKFSYLVLQLTWTSSSLPTRDVMHGVTELTSKPAYAIVRSHNWALQPSSASLRSLKPFSIQLNLKPFSIQIRPVSGEGQRLWPGLSARAK